MATITVSGTIHANDGVANLFTKKFAHTVVVSQFVARDFVIANGLSNVIMSVAEVSSPSVFLVVNNGVSNLRINFAGHPSADSAASLGFEFGGLYFVTGSGISGSIATHWANSSGDSATATVLLAN